MLIGDLFELLALHRFVGKALWKALGCCYNLWLCVLHPNKMRCRSVKRRTKKSFCLVFERSAKILCVG